VNLYCDPGDAQYLDKNAHGEHLLVYLSVTGDVPGVRSRFHGMSTPIRTMKAVYDRAAAGHSVWGELLVESLDMLRFRRSVGGA